MDSHRKSDPSKDDDDVDRSRRLSASAIHSIAGTGAGVATTILLQPLDLIKIRFQVPETRALYGGTWNAFSTIMRKEGTRALYNGLTPNLVGSGVSWGLYFYFYNMTKTYNASNTPLGSLVSAAEAGAMTTLLVNPIWVIKTRMQLQLPSDAWAYRSVHSALLTLWREEGFRGLYAGWVPALFGVAHGAVQFMVYEELKKFFQQRSADPSKNLQHSEYLGAGAISKIVASVVTYPHQVLKSRLQQHPRDRAVRIKGVVDAILATWRQEGARGFYRGIVANTLKVAPSSAITLFCYERLRILLESL